nr:integrase, catalytic region, zinc finger, CCHC-type, peptidase aspartic, catalytic [Tanacetum cinerariifolium]
MIPEPGDANCDITVTETFHLQTDDKLSDKELKQIQADDQAIQTILLGLFEDMYAAVDSCETTQEIWLRVQQMMKGSDIGIQEKKAKLFNEWERFTSNERESIESYYHHFLKLIIDLKRNKHFPEKIASNLKFLNNLQPEWSRHTTIVHQTKDLNTANYTQLYDFLKYNQKEVDELKAERIAKTQDPLALMANSNHPYMIRGNGGNQFRQYAGQNAGNPVGYNDAIGNQVIQNAIQNLRVQNVGNQNGLIGVQRNGNQNQIRNGNLVAVRAEGNAAGQNEHQIRCYNSDLDEIKEVNANCILMANLQQASTSGTQTDSAPVYDIDRSAKEKSTVSFLLEEKKRLKSDFKTCEDKLLDKQIQLEKQIKELNNIVLKMGQSIQTIHMLSPKPNSFYHTKQKMALGYQNPFYLKQAQKKQQSLYDGRVLLEKHDPPVVHDSEETLQLAQESRNKMKQMNKEIKPANYTKINHLSGDFVPQMALSREELYFSNNSKMANVSKSFLIPNEDLSDDTTPSVARKFLNEEAAKFVGDFKSLAKEADDYVAKLKALELEIERLLKEVVYDQKDNTQDSSANTKFAKQPIMENLPKIGKTNTLSKPVTLNSDSTPQESKSVNNDMVIAPGMFRITPSKTSREEKQDVISKVICAMCKKCLISVNHDKCLSNSVNAKNSYGKNQKAKVSVKEIRMKYQPKVSKPKTVGTRQSLATPKPRKSRLLLRWSPTGKLFNQEGKLVASSESKSKSACSNGNLKLLINFIWKFMGTVRFGNDHVAAILGFGDLQWGNILITRVYSVEGLGHNLFSVGQFCDSDLEVTFRRDACFIRNLEGVDLLKGDRSTNLYTINL